MKKKFFGRVLSVLILTTMVVSMLTACGGKSDGGSEDASSSDSQTLTLIMSQRDEWLSEMEEAAIKEAKDLGIKLTTVDAQLDTSKMLQFIETARNDGQKAIIINMVDPETAVQCVEAAGDMFVVFVNRYPADDSVLNEKVVYVGSDENTSGKFQGEWLAEHFKEEGKTEIKYILLNGILGQTSTTLRTASVLKALEDSGIKASEATAPLACEYAREMAQDTIAPLLKTTKYDCVISNNDGMALGAIEAMTAEGIDATTIPIVGIDATTDGRQAVKDGTLSMTVFQNAKGQGRGALIAAQNLIAGKAINDGSDYEVDESGNILWIPFEPVTKENVAEYDNR
ncbi:sugar ABC transporter substrate-binding protein [Ohessyouella blattaphilus]|uniref:Sugar ABC transporter substrate-binding protein n=1 Tax=Ohessyouella blattaphilus TaxID=2949333 RepID=A0ABT1EFA4_9FIRM|nr:sugar ABC transporter substrate-binding protein [Ohessyouella blattaphilus]MCP1109391.1 sugar ABC transporter substrate-binding protein [Ohessyouella blattaphilus]MCR8562785.1 sugar ABC transporter substrate-binding protein [Ohessyouella blattaphilus]